MNPIFESGVRRRMRTAKTPILVTLYVGALLLFSCCLLWGYMGGRLTVTAMRASTEWYIWLTALQFGLIVCIAPALGAASIAGERERQTFDLLLVSGVGARRIVWGKLMENYAFILLLLCCGFPVMMLAQVTANIPVTDLLAMLGFLAVIALAAMSVGMLTSVLTRRSLPAILVAYLLVLGIGVGSWALTVTLEQHFSTLTYAEQREMFSALSPTGALLHIPLCMFLNPAITLMLLLASQTGILKTTFCYTARLEGCYALAMHAGAARTAYASLAVILVTTLLILLLTTLALRAQIGGMRRKKRAHAMEAA